MRKFIVFAIKEHTKWNHIHDINKEYIQVQPRRVTFEQGGRQYRTR